MTVATALHDLAEVALGQQGVQHVHQGGQDCDRSRGHGEALPGADDLDSERARPMQQGGLESRAIAHEEHGDDPGEEVTPSAEEHQHRQAGEPQHLQRKPGGQAGDDGRYSRERLGAAVGEPAEDSVVDVVEGACEP